MACLSPKEHVRGVASNEDPARAARVTGGSEGAAPVITYYLVLPLAGDHPVVGNIIGVDGFVALLAQLQGNLTAVVGAVVDEVDHDLLHLVLEVVARVVVVF